MPLLCSPLPSLVDLDVHLEDSDSFQNSCKSFLKFSPDLKKLTIALPAHGSTFHKIEPTYMCRWNNLYSAVCPRVVLGIENIIHLSRMPALTRLAFMLGTIFPASTSILAFPALLDLALEAESLDLISRLLSRTRLPVITDLYAGIDIPPSKSKLSSFFTRFLTSNTDHTILGFTLNQSLPSSSSRFRRDALTLDLEDLRQCMAFSNLCLLELNIECNVGLTDSQVLTLASAWPRLQYLVINKDWGRNSRAGITPGGLVKLLQTCRRLQYITVCIATQVYDQRPGFRSRS